MITRNYRPTGINRLIIRVVFIVRVVLGDYAIISRKQIKHNMSY